MRPAVARHRQAVLLAGALLGLYLAPSAWAGARPRIRAQVGSLSERFAPADRVISVAMLINPTANCSGAAVTTSSVATTFTRTSTAYCTKDDGTLVLLSANQPRVSALGYLAEQTGTNIILQSQTLDSATWVKAGNVVAAPVVTANAALAPDGTMTAEQIDFAATSNVSSYALLYQSFTATAASYATSLYLKAVSGTPTVYLSAFFPSATYVGTKACVLNATTWTRCTTTGTLTAASWTLFIGVDRRDAAQVAQPVMSVYAWQAQVEQKTYATSPIITVASAVTRSGDLLNFTPPGSWPTSRGSVAMAVAPIWTNTSVGNGTIIWALLSPGNINGFWFRFIQSVNGNPISIRTGDGSTSAEDLSGLNAWAALTPYSVVYSWGSGAHAASINGVSKVSTTGNPMPTASTTNAVIGSNTDASNQCDCYIKNLVVTR